MPLPPNSTSECAEHAGLQSLQELFGNATIVVQPHGYPSRINDRPKLSIFWRSPLNSPHNMMS